MALNGKFIGRLVLAAAAASMIPYRVRLDKKSGGFCVNSLLWSVKKTPGEERDHYEIELLPLVGGKEPNA